MHPAGALQSWRGNAHRGASTQWAVRVNRWRSARVSRCGTLFAFADIHEKPEETLDEQAAFPIDCRHVRGRELQCPRCEAHGRGEKGADGGTVQEGPEDEGLRRDEEEPKRGVRLQQGKGMAY